jgi:hypothetical protein
MEKYNLLTQLVEPENRFSLVQENYNKYKWLILIFFEKIELFSSLVYILKKLVEAIYYFEVDC